MGESWINGSGRSCCCSCCCCCILMGATSCHSLDSSCCSCSSSQSCSCSCKVDIQHTHTHTHRASGARFAVTASGSAQSSSRRCRRRPSSSQLWFLSASVAAGCAKWERPVCFSPVPSLFLSLSPPLSLICMCRLNDILSTKLKCAWHTERASPTRVSFPTSRLCPPAGGTAAAASAACRLSQQIACSCFASQCASFMSLLSVYPVLNLNRWCDATWYLPPGNIIHSLLKDLKKSLCVHSLICPSVYKPLLKSIHRETEKLLS